MRRLLRWIGRGLAGLILLILVAVVVIQVWTGLILARTYDVPVDTVVVPADAAAIERGERYAKLRGCFGCHGENLEGEVLFQVPFMARFATPNLTTVVQDYTDVELASILRHGIRPDGSSVIGMPSAMLYHLSDADLGDLIAYVRSRPVVDNEVPDLKMWTVARLFMILGRFEPEAATIEHDAPRIPKRTDDPAAFGEYLAMTACVECHGADLAGNEEFPSPDLAIAASYTAEQ